MKDQTDSIRWVGQAHRRATAQGTAGLAQAHVCNRCYQAQGVKPGDPASRPLRGLLYCLHTIKVTTATNTMNALELVRRQMLRQMAIKEARLVQLTYRGNTYVKQQNAESARA